MTTTAQAAITIDDVSVAFGGVKAVQHCRFTIPQGAITGLIGPNGAGKTTLFNTIAGRYYPARGRVLLFGEDITRLADFRRFRRGLARTFQLPHEFYRLTVRENLMVAAPAQRGENLFNAWINPRATARQEQRLAERAEEALALIGLSHLRHQLAGQLSGGQKKLLELGRAIMADPRVVLLDEPGAGVNRTLLGRLADAIATLNRERGLTFCIIDHDMDLITRLCHPVVVMAEGTVLTQGAMAEVVNHPAVLAAYLGDALIGSNEPEAAP